MIFLPFVVVVIWISLKGTKGCRTKQLDMDLLYHYNNCVIKFYYSDVNEYEQLSFVTCCFHIARNKNCFSLYNGIKPVTATGRFPLFACFYLFTRFRWKFRNGAKRNLGRRIVLSGSNYFNEHQC